MEILFLLALGAGLWGQKFVQFQIAGIEVIYWGIFALLCYYVYEVIIKRRLIIKNTDWLWFDFIAYGCVRAGLSLLGITDGFISEKLPLDMHYLPRQAYYLALMPVVLLTVPTKGKAVLAELLRNHSRILFFVVLLLGMIHEKSIVTSITTTFLLAFLSLRDEKHDWVDWLMFGVIMIPVAFTDIQITDLLIRFIYAVCFLFRKRSKFVSWGMAAGIWFCVGLCFVAALFAEELGQIVSDPNTLWRAQFWSDELKMLAESRFLGVGYGTAYCSTDFIDAATYLPWGDGDPFVATAHYSVYDKVFVTGAHSSFITVAFRLGVVGIVLFAAYLIVLQFKQLKHLDSVSLRSYYALCSSVVIIALNVGLESPYYLLLFLFSVYWSNFEIKNSK